MGAARGRTAAAGEEDRGFEETGNDSILTEGAQLLAGQKKGK